MAPQDASVRGGTPREEVAAEQPVVRTAAGVIPVAVFNGLTPEQQVLLLLGCAGPALERPGLSPPLTHGPLDTTCVHLFPPAPCLSLQNRVGQTKGNHFGKLENKRLGLLCGHGPQGALHEAVPQVGGGKGSTRGAR